MHILPFFQLASCPFHFWPTQNFLQGHVPQGSQLLGIIVTIWGTFSVWYIILSEAVQ